MLQHPQHPCLPGACEIDERTGAAPCFCCFLLVREVGDVYNRRLIPLLCVWKIVQKKFDVEKHVSEFSAVNFDYI